MMKIAGKSEFIYALLIVFVAVSVLLSVAPIFNPIPGRDQGVYLYIGQGILNGQVPYRDIWDHKGPLIYFINALGLLLTGSSLGVWILEVFLLAVSALLAYQVLREMFGSLTALTVSLLWLGALRFVLDQGNTVEEYSLLCQFGAIYIYSRTRQSLNTQFQDLSVGVTAGLAFLLRPNNIGLHVALVLTMILDHAFSGKLGGQLLKRILWMAAGAWIVVGLVIVYFALNQSLAQFWDSVFVYNYYYSIGKDIQWGRAFAKGYDYLSLLIWLGAIGVVGAAASILINWKKDDPGSRIALLSVLALPLQIYLSLLSGRRYLHYYIAWLPVLVLLSGFCLYWFQEILKRVLAGMRFASLPGVLASIMLGAYFGVLPLIRGAANLLPPGENGSVAALPFSNEIVDYIQKNTAPNDYVLIWGNEVAYNFITRRQSPSRFVYTYPFGVEDYVTQEMVDQFWNDIVQKRPMIIDAAVSDRAVPRLRVDPWKRIPVSQKLVELILENYMVIDHIGPDKWPVLAPKDDALFKSGS